MAEWKPMETAPKDGTEILGCRDDCGVLLVRWTCLDNFMTATELNEIEISEEDSGAEDWFYADFCEGGRLEGTEVPTHWMPLPEPPEEAKP